VVPNSKNTNQYLYCSNDDNVHQNYYFHPDLRGGGLAPYLSQITIIHLLETIIIINIINLNQNFHVIIMIVSSKLLSNSVLFSLVHQLHSLMLLGLSLHDFFNAIITPVPLNYSS